MEISSSLTPSSIHKYFSLLKKSLYLIIFFSLAIFCSALNAATVRYATPETTRITEGEDSDGFNSPIIEVFYDGEVPARDCTVSGEIIVNQANSTATEGADFTIANKEFSIAISSNDGQGSSNRFRGLITAIDDGVIDGESQGGQFIENINLDVTNLQSDCGFNVLTTESRDYFIVDNGNDGEVEIASADIWLYLNEEEVDFDEAYGSVSMEVDLEFNGGSLPQNSCTISGDVVALTNSTATENEDFTITNRSFTIPYTPDEFGRFKTQRRTEKTTPQSLEVTLIDDDFVDGENTEGGISEQVFLGIANVSNDCGIESIETSTTSFRIFDNDEEPEPVTGVSIEINSSATFNEDEGDFSVPVNLVFGDGAVPTQSCSISGEFVTSQDESTSAPVANKDEDFTVTTNTFTFFLEPSEGLSVSEVSINGTIIDDTLVEGASSEAGPIEAALLGITNVTNDCDIETIETRSATLYIVDNDGNTEPEIVEPTVTPLSEKEGLNKLQVSIAEALDNSCTALSNLVNNQGEGGSLNINSSEQSLLSICNQLQSSNTLASDLEALSPKKFSAMRELSIRGGMQQNQNLSKQLARTRQGARGFDVSDLSLNVYGQRLAGRYIGDALGAGAGDDIQSDWSAFVGGSVQVGEYDEQDFDLQGNNIYAGLNYQLNSTVIVGAALGYNSSEANFDSKGNDIEFESYNIALLGSYYVNDDFYLDSVFTYGINDYGTERRVAIGANRQQNVADTNGAEMTFAVNTGYTLNTSNYFFTLFAAINYLNADIDQFDEKAKGTAPLLGSLLTINEQDFKSLTTNVGIEMGLTLSTKTGVIVPKLSLDWEQQHEDDAGIISTQFVADPTNTSWDVTTQVADDNYYNAALSLNAVFKNGFSAYIVYDTELGREDISLYEVSLGARWEF